MKIKSESAVLYRIIDSINARSWLFMALSTTLLALMFLWTLGIAMLRQLI